VGGHRIAPRPLAVYEQFLEWEFAVADGRLPTDLRPEYYQIMDRWPDAFEFYRHSLYLYLEQNLNLNPWGVILRSILTRAAATDPTGASAFLKSVSQEIGRFSTQRKNIAAPFNFQFDLSSVDSPEHLRSLLRSYIDVYEVDFALWYLGVLGRTERTHRFHLGAYGGPASTTPQASLAEQVSKDVQGTPIGWLFDRAYDSELRNTIAHNDYEIVGRTGRLVVRNLTTGREWTQQDVLDRLTASLSLLEGVLHCAVYVHFVDQERSRADFPDCGVIQVSFTVTGGHAPYLVLLQLWCFRNLDPSGDWIDKAGLRLSRAGDGERLQLTENAWTEGKPISPGPVGDAFRRYGWSLVTRVPVAPDLGLGFPTIQDAEGTRYEVVGPADEHVVPVVLAPERSEARRGRKRRSP